MNDPKKQFYYRGKYFSNESDFWDGVREFHASPVTEESIEDLVKELMGNLKMNFLMSMPKMTNDRFKFKLEQVFIYSMQLMAQEGDKKPCRDCGSVNCGQAKKDLSPKWVCQDCGKWDFIGTQMAQFGDCIECGKRDKYLFPAEAEKKNYRYLN